MVGQAQERGRKTRVNNYKGTDRQPLIFGDLSGGEQRLVNIIHKVLAILFVALASNHVRHFLEVNPQLAPLGYSMLWACGYALFFSFFLASCYYQFIGIGRVAIYVGGICAATYLLYPAHMFFFGIYHDVINSIPLWFYLYTSLIMVLFLLQLFQLKKENMLVDLSTVHGLELLVGGYFILSLPMLYLSGLLDKFTPTFLNQHATFLYVVFIVMLISAWIPKALRILPHLIFLWSLIFPALIIHSGFFRTGYFITVGFHAVWALMYLREIWEQRMSANKST